MSEHPDPVSLAVAAADAADDKKATDLMVLEVGEILALVELFMLATASNERQLKAVSDSIEKRLREEFGLRPLRREGEPASGWMLLDYGDVVCHLFAAEQRDYYGLERLWSDVVRRDPVTGQPQPPASHRMIHQDAEVGA